MSTDTTPSLDLLGSAAELPTPVVKSRTAASRVEDLIVNQKQLHQLNQDTTTAHTEGLAMEFHPGWQCHFLKCSSAAPGDHRWGHRYDAGAKCYIVIIANEKLSHQKHVCVVTCQTTHDFAGVDNILYRRRQRRFGPKVGPGAMPRGPASRSGGFGSTIPGYLPSWCLGFSALVELQPRSLGANSNLCITKESGGKAVMGLLVRSESTTPRG